MLPNVFSDGGVDVDEKRVRTPQGRRGCVWRTRPASRSEDMERVVAATKGVLYCHRHHRKCTGL